MDIEMTKAIIEPLNPEIFSEEILDKALKRLEESRKEKASAKKRSVREESKRKISIKM